VRYFDDMRVFNLPTVVMKSQMKVWRVLMIASKDSVPCSPSISTLDIAERSQIRVCRVSVRVSKDSFYCSPSVSALEDAGESQIKVWKI